MGRTISPQHSPHRSAKGRNAPCKDVTVYGKTADRVVELDDPHSLLGTQGEEGNALSSPHGHVGSRGLGQSPLSGS